ncbi:unnamed protein product [Symbiodinium sp. CCMP2592]|nr:unnamed protein product [Symbiodinium sp. CCMP2592]
MDGDSPAQQSRQASTQIESGGGSGSATVAQRPPTVAQAKGKAAAAKVPRMCAAEDCPNEACRNQRWCQDHRRAHAAMVINARKQGQEDELKEVMSCEIRSKVAMRDWCEKNPVDGKWSRKRTHDFAQYQHVEGTLDEHGDNDQDWPMTEAEFLHWATDTKRLTSTGASNWWKELLVSCKKDFKGREPHGALGAQRLWVPAAEFSQRKRARFNQSQVVENSRPMRRLAEDDLDDLRAFAASRTADESFLRGEPRRVAPRVSQPQTPTGAGLPSTAAAGTSPAGAEANTSPQKEKAVDLALEKPKLINKQKAELRGLETGLREAARKGMEQWTACSKDSDSTSDPSLQALMPHLEFRLRCSAAVFEYKDVDFLQDVSFAKDKDSVEDLLKNNPEMLPVQEEHVKHLQSFSGLQDGIDKVVAAATTVAQLEEAKEAWGAKKLALKSLEKGVNQATKDAKSRKAQQQKEAQRKAQAEQKKKDREQVDAFKEQSDQRAKALLAEKKGGISKKGYVACQFMFDKMSQNALPDGFSLQSFTEVEVGKLPSMSGPWVLRGAAAVAVDKWSTNTIVTKTTQAYAVKYKAFPDYLNRGRVSAAFEAKHGHENTVDMFSGMVPHVKNMQAFPASQTFQNTTWLAGYSPEMRFVGLQANGALTLKTMAMGQVLHVCLSCTDVVKGLMELGMLKPDSKFADVDGFCSLLEDLDMDAFVKMHKAGVKLYMHKAIPGEVIGIPMGWFCFELAVDGAVLVAARQGFFIVDTSEEDLNQYKSMRDILIMCGKAGDKYNQIIDMLSQKGGDGNGQ